MAATTGTRVTTQTALFNGVSSQRLFGFDGLIAELAPDQSPFLTFLNRLSRKTINDPDYKYTEYRAAYLTRPSFYAAEAEAITALAAGTSFTLDITPTIAGTAANVTGLKVNDIIQLVVRSSSSETSTVANALVTALTDASSPSTFQTITCTLLTDKPGFNTVAHTTAASATIGYVVGNAFGEGSEAATADYEADVIKWASAEISKERFTISETLRRLVQAGDIDEAMKQYKRALARLKAKVERKFLYASSRVGSTVTDPFSAPSSAVTNAAGDVVRTSTSLLQACKMSQTLTGSLATVNITSSSTLAALMAGMQQQFKYGSSTKYAFVGDGFLSMINALLFSDTFTKQLSMNASIKDEQFGININKLYTPYGELNLVRDKTMTQDGIYTNTMFVVDPENIDLLMYRDVDLYDLPSTKDIEDKEFRCEMGLCVKLPETHGFWYMA